MCIKVVEAGNWRELFGRVGVGEVKKNTGEDVL
jgi:hypothetical protein